MKYSMIICLLLCAFKGWSQPEWQFYVPAETVDINGVVVKPNQALLVNRVNTVIGIGLENFDSLPFTLDDASAITAISVDFRNVSRLTLAFSKAVDEYLPGDVVACGSNCEKLFSLADDFGLPRNIYVDALNWESDSQQNQYLIVSFSQDFIYNGDFYQRNNAYLVNFPVSGPQLSNSVVIGGDEFDVLSNMNLMGLDSAAINGSFYELHVSDTVFKRENDEVVFPAEFFERSNQDITNFFTDILANEARGIMAVATLDTGWVGWDNGSMDIEVSENVGFSSLVLHRSDGKERYIDFNVINTDNSAIQGVDYNMGPTTFSWLHADDNDQSVEIEIIDNDLVDGNRSFTLFLEPQSEYALTAFNLSNQITVTILDDDGDLIFKNGFE